MIHQAKTSEVNLLPARCLSRFAARPLRFILFTVLACLFFLTGDAQAKIMYVATDGNANYPGTLRRPLATPAQALAMSEAGDTIYLRQGHYKIDHFLWVDKANLTIASYPGERATLASGTEESEANANNLIIVVADKVAVVDLDIEGGSYYGIKVDVDKTSSTRGVSIRGCRIRNTGRDCIKTFRADDLLIENCEIGPSGARDASNAEGIDAIASLRVTIRGCYIHDTATNGLYLKGGTRDGVVEGNRIERCGHSGILLGQDTDEEAMRDAAKYEAINCVARNNLISDTQAAGVGSYSGSHVRFENNTIYDVAKALQAGFYVVTNTRAVMAEKVSFKNNIMVVNSTRPLIFIKDLADPLICDANIYFSPIKANHFHREVELAGKSDKWNFADWKRNLRVDEHSRFADPMVDAANRFVPRPGSPAFDSGETLAEVKTDYAGKARPQGAAFDIGAYEGSASAIRSEATKAIDAAPDGEVEARDSLFSSGKKTILATVLFGGCGGLAIFAIQRFRAKIRLTKNIRI
jgi:hypothetical protein